MMFIRIFKKCSLLAYSLLLLGVLSSTLSAQNIDDLATRAKAGEQKAVLTELEQLLAGAPEHYEAAFLKARLLAEQGEYVQATSIYRDLIKQSPKRPEAYNNLARLLAKQGNLEQAQKLLEQAMQTHPSYAAVYENLSAVYVEMARDSYSKALRLDTPAKTVALREINDIPVTTPQTTGVIDRTGQQVAVKDKKGETETAVVAKSIPPPVAAPTINKQEIITTLQGWAAAWSEQAVDMYLVFYDDSYSPPGQARQRWESQRRIRVKKPSWIRVGLSDFDIQPINDKEARVRLIQDYRASNFKDRTRKEFELRATPDGWRIIAERDLSRVN